MPSKPIIKEKSIFIYYKPILSYEDFIKKDIYKIFLLDEQKIKISNTDGKKLDEEVLIDYQAYKNIFDTEYKILDDYNLEIGFKDYISIQIVKKYIGFGFSTGLLRNIFKLLEYNISDIFEEKNMLDGDIVLNILNRKLNSKDSIEKIYAGGLLDYFKYRKLKDKRDKLYFKESYDSIRKIYDKKLLDYFNKNIKYSEKLKKNYYIEYMIFNIIFLKEELYLCNYKNNSFFIINKEKLVKSVNYPILVFSLNNILTPLLFKYKQDFINKVLLKQGLKIKDITKSNIPDELKKIISNTDYIEIKIKKNKDGKLHLLEGKKEFIGDDDKFVELKKQYPYSEIKSINFAGKTNKIEVIEQIKLDNKDK